MEVAGPLGTPLGLAQRKRASPRGEAGTSGFLCVSDSDRHQAPLSTGFSRQEYWSGLPFPSPEELPDLGVHLDIKLELEVEMIERYPG